MLNFIKLMRLPFLSASVIPYFIGAAYCLRKGYTDIINIRFFLGLCAVIFAHIGANILNDYFDSKSGNDWQDRNEHIFFGGSKIIQKGLLSEKEVFKIGVIFILVSALSIILLQIIIRNIPIVLFGAFILFLAVSYSAPPLKLAYRGLGEAVIFILFGNAVVAGSYTILTKTCFGLNELLLSLPISFLVTAILYCNEVPDYQIDKNVHKDNLVVRIGLKFACWGYLFLVLGAFLSIILCAALKILPVSSLFLLFLFLLFIKPFVLIKKEDHNLERLKIASKFTIIGHGLVGLGLICLLIL